jgi:hypothetical protein
VPRGSDSIDPEFSRFSIASLGAWLNPSLQLLLYALLETVASQTAISGTEIGGAFVLKVAS